MLPKDLRLPPKEIPAIAYRGKKISGKYFDIRVWYDRNLQKPELAISISTKVSKNAVVRNKIKRRLRVAIQELTKTGQLRPNKYLIIVRSPDLAKPEISPLEELRKQLV